MNCDYSKRGYLLPKRRRNWAHIAAHLSRVLKSEAIYQHLTILSFDHQIHTIHLKVLHSKGELTLHVDCADTKEEQTLRALFGERGILPSRSAAVSSDGVTHRILWYPLPASAPIAAKLVASLLHRVYALPPDAELHFFHYENDGA
jgi:hypothetical protein